MHIDASAYALGCILTQPHEHNMDFLVTYASRQLNSAEKNYTTTERLAMVYAVKKFRHYLLANRFIFFVDHHALMYLVNKPCATGRIVRWFVILLEFDFTIAVKLGRSHQRADHLSRITNGEVPTGVDDNLPDATLFQIDIAPRWAEPILEVLSVTAEWAPKDAQTTLNQLRESDRYTIISGRLYRQGSNNVLILCVEPEDHREIIEDAHISLGGIHEAKQKTT